MWLKIELNDCNKETQQNKPKKFTLSCASKWQENFKNIWPKVKLTKWLQQGNIAQTTQKIYTLTYISKLQQKLNAYDPKQNWQMIATRKHSTKNRTKLHITMCSKCQQKLKDVWPKAKLTKWPQQGNITQTIQKNYTSPCAWKWQ
jgi:hypothetical protein